MSLLDGLMGAFDDNAIDNMSSQIGASKSQTKTALGSLLPILLNSVSKQGNSNSSGLGSFVGFLDADKDGSILDDVAGFVLSGKDGNSGNILSSLLGGNQNQIQGYVSDDSGISSDATSKLMQLAAPVVISYLARRNKQSDSETGLGDLLGGFLGDMNNKAPQSSGVIDQLLDNNKSTVDNDIANLGGSLLGSLFR
ncbi:MAG: DUF937 domain-containing protein [Cyclobacteriaceae bacterium]